MSAESTSSDTAHIDVRQRVWEHYDAHHDVRHNQSVSPDYIGTIIDKLHRGRSPGIDGISPEHLIHGKSDKLLLILSSLYSVILSRACKVK